MAIDLSDPSETRSFLVPAYEFARGSDARKFDPDRHPYIGPVNGPDDTYRLVHRDEHHFHPRASGNFLLSAGALHNPSIGVNNRPFFVRFQAAPGERPDGVRSVCLTVEGRRLSPRREDGRTDLVPSYAAWQMPNGGPPLWVARTTYAHADGQAAKVASKTIGAHWSGQGALCAIEPDRVERLLLVEFRVYDQDPDKGDLLKIWVSRHAFAAGALPDLGPTGATLDGSWRLLISRARRGFSEECGP